MLRTLGERILGKMSATVAVTAPPRERRPSPASRGSAATRPADTVTPLRHDGGMKRSGTIERLVAEFDGCPVVDPLAELRARLVATFDDEPDLERWLHPAGAAPQTPVPGSLIDEAVGRALTAVQSLIVDSGAQLDRDALERLVLGIEQVRRSAESAAVAVAGVVDASNPFLDDGFRSGKNWLRHHAQLSRAEAFRRIQRARMQRRLPDWNDAADVGDVGIAQSELMGQIAANPRIDQQVLTDTRRRTARRRHRIVIPGFRTTGTIAGSSSPTRSALPRNPNVCAPAGRPPWLRARWRMDARRPVRRHRRGSVQQRAGPFHQR